MELRIDGEERKNERQTGELINLSLIKLKSHGAPFHSFIYPVTNTHKLAHDALYRVTLIASRSPHR